MSIMDLVFLILLIIFVYERCFLYAAILTAVYLMYPQEAEAAANIALTANQDWKAFYAIMICAIWCLLYWMLKPIGEIVISWLLPNGSSYANVQQWMGCYLCVMLFGCLFNLSLLGA